MDILVHQELSGLDTIAAIATAMSPSGIGIVRISGEDAFSIIDRVYRPKRGKKKLSDCESHTIHYGFICDGEETIDEVMVLLMRAPRSYTAEDTVEIDCHGGVYVMKRILETVLKYGARPAEPGEFTKRAFLNGRIDLTQAESVMDIINSKNEYALKASLAQLKGSMLADIRNLREMLLHELAYIEAALDDPEHISLENYADKLEKIVDSELMAVDKLLNSFENGRIFREGIRTAIVGKPNVGKSSLLNTLLGEERAIVTEVAGTTRDVLEEQTNLNGLTLLIMDTAGIRNTDDVVEKIGVNKTKECLSNCDLIIYVVDASQNLSETDEEIIELLKGKKVIVLLNKSDLDTVITLDDMKKRLEHRILFISAKERTGMEELEETIRDMFFQGEISFQEEGHAVNIRQKNALESARKHLLLVKRSIADNMPEDFLSIDLMSAYEAMGSVIGESVEEDLVDKIFSEFCMGK
ncbi:MAG: tRNA uridine-5-carboxymethylaminomethyl(34) synthesis GTPase MnmE [Muribaculaceae bacterium]|nr:tRNA uridine-5-carboxymethylaminomethyl(34) synthesis GTPase MnmE [Roseburia sp.]MCM1430034.1 tRNA uridine-5-carboxymethylaminomethyl(34) synthesis GTPase MnmE [Muribaculaceae bacterium]MCM1492939.1 tRNA uridine-5-carboxymethylaminomethyl(34) synthesis GTPase MnmE [Muribaculaceae bacterium]